MFFSCYLCSFSNEEECCSECSETESVDSENYCVELESEPAFENVTQQIRKNLNYYKVQMDGIELLLSQSVLCIGTGRVQRINLLHPIPTIIRKKDFCIDSNSRLQADFVMDAFSLREVKKLPQDKFAFVFFAHVGVDALFFENAILVVEEYQKRLVDGGFFIYNSEVSSTPNFTNHLQVEHKVSSFADAKKYWKKILIQAKFKNICIVLKDEKDFCEEAVSILIIAQKAY